MKHKVAELEGVLLDAAVAKAEGWGWSGAGDDLRALPFSSEWEYGGPIIERERIDLEWEGLWPDCPPQSGLRAPRSEDEQIWAAKKQSNYDAPSINEAGPTPLIAAMRAYVASKFGDEVELP